MGRRGADWHDRSQPLFWLRQMLYAVKLWQARMTAPKLADFTKSLFDTPAPIRF
jgi:hypothetical protein